MISASNPSSKLSASSGHFAHLLESALSKTKTLLTPTDAVPASATLTTTYNNTVGRQTLAAHDSDTLIRENVAQDLRSLNRSVNYDRSLRQTQTLQERTETDDRYVGFEESAEAKHARKEMVEALRRTTALEPRPRSQTKTAGPVAAALSEDSALAQYHNLKHEPTPRLTKDLLQFLSSRVNPPSCVLELLDAFISLVYGIFSRVEQHYFALGEKKYFIYKQYLSFADELLDTTAHLKIYMETQGVPERNINKAEAALARYRPLSTRPEARQYLPSLQVLEKFLTHHLQYYRLLRVAFVDHQAVDAEPLTRNAPSPSATILRQHNKQLDWVLPLEKDVRHLTEDQLISLIALCGDREVFKSLQSSHLVTRHGLASQQRALGTQGTATLVERALASFRIPHQTR